MDSIIDNKPVLLIYYTTPYKQIKTRFNTVPEAQTFTQINNITQGEIFERVLVLDR